MLKNYANAYFGTIDFITIFKRCIVSFEFWLVFKPKASNGSKLKSESLK